MSTGVSVVGEINATSPIPPPVLGAGVIQQSDLILIHGFLVFFMQTGFVSLELGYGRSKNVRNILLKNFVDLLLCALCWWLVGYGLENGNSAGGFMGSSSFAGESEGNWNKSYFFTFSFALCTISIVGGCLAERTHLLAYPIFTVVTSSWVYPVFAFWVWNQQSWLQNLGTCQFLDFAGGAVVHATGGCMGLVGAILCGPRMGRFEDGVAKSMPGHDASSVAMGTIFLWFGWLGFNCGSLYLQPNGPTLVNTGYIVDRIALNMTLSAAGSGLTALTISSIQSGTFDLVVLCNGILSGLVSATATCGYVAPWAALVIGVISGSAYICCSRMLLRLQIDDPLDSTAIHLCGGLVGTLLNSMFAEPYYLTLLLSSQCGGFIYTSTGGSQLGMQLLGVVLCLSWSTAFSLLVFLPLKYFRFLRVDQATELAGIDNIEHGGPAYPEFNLVNYSVHGPQG